MEEKKKSKKGLIFVIALILGLSIGIGGSYYYFNVMNKDSKSTSTVKTKDSKVEITSNDEDEMFSVSKMVFDDSKSKSNFNDLDNQKKISIAMGLLGDSYDFEKVKGKDLVEVVKQKFGDKATLKLEDIKCFSDHGSADANTMYKYDKSTDKFTYNNNHPGHGGGGKRTPVLVKDKVSVKDGKYNLVVGIYYTEYDCSMYDTCGPAKEAGHIYKTAEDAENKTNMIFDASKNQKLYYVSGVTNDEYNYDWDKVEKEIKDKLYKYTFVFEMKDNKLIFKEYKKDK